MASQENEAGDRHGSASAAKAGAVTEPGAATGGRSDDLVFTLLHNPEHGTLYLGGTALSEGATFTQFDLDNGLLSYEVDRSEPFRHGWAEGTPSWEGGSRHPVDPANLTVPENADSVLVSFESESAGYRHSIGWCRFDEDGRPSDPQFLWADVAEGRNSLPPGTTLTLSGLRSGEPFGLFIIQGGAETYGWLPDMVDAQASFRFDEHGDLVVGNRSIPADHILFAGDAALNADGLNHTLSGIDGDRLMIGFGDSAGDERVAGPMIAVRYEGSPLLPDSDSFSFVATESAAHLAELAPTLGGYSVADGAATFSFTIAPAATAAI
jgi:hypothetical protein